MNLNNIMLSEEATMMQFHVCDMSRKSKFLDRKQISDSLGLKGRANGSDCLMYLGFSGGGMIKKLWDQTVVKAAHNVNVCNAIELYA